MTGARVVWLVTGLSMACGGGAAEVSSTASTASTASAEPSEVSSTASTASVRSAEPSEADCRGWLEDGSERAKDKLYDEARELFHTARQRCANVASLVMIAKTYEDQGDLPRALAYGEQFLAQVGQGHELRAPLEKAADYLRKSVPPEQRVDISAELAARTSVPIPEAEPTINTDEDVSNRSIDFTENNMMAGSDEPGRKAVSLAPGRGFFVGANVAYAPVARVEVGSQDMTATTDFPRAFTAELQLGYRLLPRLSLAIAPQMAFNLRPEGERSASELDVFAVAIGHHSFTRDWDFNLFAGPGYSELIVPGARNARGLALRYGGGPMFHLSERFSLAVELNHQIGFQNAGSADMATSFLMFLAGARLRL